MDIKDLKLVANIGDFKIISIGHGEKIVKADQPRLDNSILDRLRLIIDDDRQFAGYYPIGGGECSICAIEGEFIYPFRTFGHGGYVWLKEGFKVYSFPGIIVHLIEEHGYIPPQEFQDALISESSSTVLQFFESEEETESYRKTYSKMMQQQYERKHSDEFPENFERKGFFDRVLGFLNK